LYGHALVFSFDADKAHFATWLWIYNEDQPSHPMSIMHPKKPEAVPLYYATMLGFCDLAEHLIVKHLEHINAKGRLEVTLLHVAVSAEHTDILLSLLIGHGVDVKGQGMGIHVLFPIY
jgi:hypothetical protein